MKAENKRCCRHYREGLSYCAECAKDEAERNEALHAQIAELKAELAEARAEVEHWKGECSGLVRMAHEMRAEIDYFQTLIDLQHRRTMEADKLWQQAHNQPDVLPDLGKLIEWLLLRLKNQETIIEANSATVKAKDAEIENIKAEQETALLNAKNYMVKLSAAYLAQDAKIESMKCCYNCKYGPMCSVDARVCSGCSFAHNNPADGQMRWEAKL